MRKPRILLLTLFFAIPGTLLVLALTHEHEPAAHGHRLSFWVERDYGWFYYVTSPAEREQAPVAINEIGTNALPFLLKWMDYQRPPWKSTWIEMASRLPGWVPGKRRFTTDMGEVRAKAAPQVFKTLGAAAAPAVPELEARAQDTNATTRSSYALISLCNIGPAGVPSIAKALSNPRLAMDHRIAAQIGDLGTNGQPLIAPLLELLSHTNADIEYFSIRTLSYLRLQPDMVVPALAQKLADSQPSVRYQVLTALPLFGSGATPALPQITNTLSDTDAGVRRNATNAIAIITASSVRR